MKSLRKILALLLCLSLFAVLAPAAWAEGELVFDDESLITAETFDNYATDVFPDNLGLTQQTSYTCTLASAAMMLRGRMYRSNNDKWSSVTESSIKPVAWDVYGSLGYSWTYSIDGNSMTVSHRECSGFSVSSLKSLLDAHPEGIVLYDRAVPHAVFVCDYQGDTFYCFDPANSSYSGRRTLSNSWLATRVGNQASILSGADDYWYVSSYSIAPTSIPYPGKPSFIGLSGTHEASSPVTFAWNATANTTHYNFWLYSGNTGTYEQIMHSYEVSSGFQLNLKPGYYKAILQAYNSNQWLPDHSDWVYTESDPTYFEVISTTYTVSYSANGGTGAPDDQIKTKDVNLTLSLTKPTRANASAGSYTVNFNANGGSVSTASKSAARTTSYSFRNWNTAQNGSGTSYPSGGTYSANESVTLYAQWNSSTSTAAISLPTPTRDGYTFKGWSTSSTATSGVTGSYTPSGNVTLYAVWEKYSSGSWGNLTWALDKNGLLTIAGSGSMNDFLMNSSDAWLKYKNDITSIQINNGVTSIGRWAFPECRNLETVSIPASVTSIGYRAFSNCDSILSITIPNSVSSIEEHAFYHCDGLSRVDIPSSVNSIGYGAFAHCATLTEIQVDENNAYYCDADGVLFNKSMTEIMQFPASKGGQYAIPSGVTKIGDNCFAGSSNVTGVVIPTSVTHIGNWAFLDCRGLVSISIPKSVKTIFMGAFSGCSSLTNVEIPSGVENIDYYLFENCSNLKNVTIPASVTSISERAFNGCGNLTDVHFIGTPSQWNAINIGKSNDPLLNAAIHFGLYGTWGNLKWTLDNNGVLTISGSGAMDDFTNNSTEAWHAGKENVLQIVLQNGVTTIGQWAFSDLQNLTSVTLPNSLLSIGFNAFNACNNLTNIAIPASVTNISSQAFQNCSNLTSISVDAGNNTYSDINGVLFSKDKTIIRCVPAGRSGNYQIPSGVKTIASSSFWNCQKLTNVIIPQSVVTIEMSAFGGCYRLTSITIPEGVKSIGMMCFSFCSNLKSVIIPKSMETIDVAAFMTCPLTDVWYGGPAEQWQTINIGQSNNNLLSATIHYGIVPDLILPAALTTIEDEAFAGGAFTYVKLPDNAVSIGRRAFADCPNLAYIYIPKATGTIARDAFEGVSDLTILGHSGSYAEFYAQRNGIAFVAVG